LSEGASVAMLYMKRLIVPRSQRTMKSTVLPSIVVVCAMSAGRGMPGVYGCQLPAVVR
jgi:Na+/H+-translocating membrane pyrophosphatase